MKFAIAAILSFLAVTSTANDLNDQSDPWQDELGGMQMDAESAILARTVGDCRGHSRWPDDVTWCEISNGPTDARMWMTTTRIVEVGAADDPLSPAYPVRLYHELCDMCENSDDKLVYISEVIEVDEETDTARKVMRDGTVVWHTLDLAKMAVSKKLWVRVTVRTDLVGKRNIDGKYRDPIVRLWVLNP